jgi:hypothetical protein
MVINLRYRNEKWDDRFYFRWIVEVCPGITPRIFKEQVRLLSTRAGWIIPWLFLISEVKLVCYSNNL